MAHEQHSLSAILDKMDAIANEHFGGDTSSNVYSIYMRLNDMEKIQFARHSYLFCRAILSVTSVTNCSSANTGCYSGDRSVSDEDKRLEISDKRELVRMKHDAILTGGKIILAVLGTLFTGVILMTFVSPSTIKTLGKIGTVLGVMFGG